MEHFPHIHYDTHGLTQKERIAICEEALLDAYEFHVDKLDMDVGYGRQRIDMSFNEIMSHFKRDSHFVVIYRRGYQVEPGKEDRINKWHLEVGFSTMGAGPSYYLWLSLDQSLVERYVRKYGLHIHE